MVLVVRWLPQHQQHQDYLVVLDYPEVLVVLWRLSLLLVPEYRPDQVDPLNLEVRQILAALVFR